MRKPKSPQAKKFVVGCSPITSTIFAGHVINDLWMSDRKDVTDSAPEAVALYLLQTDQYIEYDIEGKKYHLKLVEVGQ